MSQIKQMNLLIRVALFVGAVSLCNWTRSQSIVEFWEQRLTPNEERYLSGAPIRTKVEVDGVDRLFMVDTGASDNIFDSSLQSSLHKPIGERTFLSVGLNATSVTFRSSFFEGPGIKIGERNFKLQHVSVLDLQGFSRAGGDYYQGVLGAPFVLEHGLGFDHAIRGFYTGRISLRSFDSKFPIEIDSNRLFCDQVRLAGRSEKFQIDTGLTGVVTIDSELFERLKSSGEIREISGGTRVQTLAGTEHRRKGIVTTLEIWGTHFENVTVTENDRNMIGLRLMTRFSFFIDGPTETIEVSRHFQTHDPFLWDQSGISFVCAEGRLVIDEVQARSPANQCELKAGDVILSVNGVPVTADWQVLTSLREEFATPSPASFRLVILDDNEQREVELQW